MWTFNTNAVNANLLGNAVSRNGVMGLNVVMLRDVPPALRDELVALKAAQ